MEVWMVERYDRGAWLPDGIGCSTRRSALGRIDGLVKNAGYSRTELRTARYIRARVQRPKRKS